MPGRFRLASPVTAGVLGGLLLVLIAVGVPLVRLAHQVSPATRDEDVEIWFRHLRRGRV